MEQTPEEYCGLLSNRMRATYNAIGRVFCPVLKREIVFNAKGFHHLHYKPNGIARPTKEKIYKLNLFPLAVSVIKKSAEIHDERDIFVFKKKIGNIKAKQYALVATVGKQKSVKIRVIVLETEKSKDPIFWSIMKH